MKYRPSRNFVYLMVALCPLTVALYFGLMPELPGFEARAIPGEIAFSSATPPAGQKKVAKRTATKSVRAEEWMEEGYENFMKWDNNPWKSDRHSSFGGHYLQLLSSKDPKDQAYCREIGRQVEAWYRKLMLRYPELAVEMRTVPDEENAFLKWLELSARVKEERKGQLSMLGFPPSLEHHLMSDGPWDPDAATTWLAQNQSRMDEIHAIAGMTDASVNGIAVERWTDVPVRLALDCARSLMFEARLAAEQGDPAAALESIRAAKNFSDHFMRVESPTLWSQTIQMIIQRDLTDLTFNCLLQTLPAGSVEADAWQTALNPAIAPPSEFARSMKGEWGSMIRYWVLPIILDTEEPDRVTDGAELLDTQAIPYRRVVRTFEQGELTDIPNLDDSLAVDFSHLSRNGRKLGEILSTGADHWSESWKRAQSGHAMTLAAFAVMKGQPVPKDPIYGKEYTWDPTTRVLSMPSGEDFERMKIKPITIPRH
ncbi:MAG: hypothetical protein V4584_01150 [Verrucomicrobiota bacterium]